MTTAQREPHVGAIVKTADGTNWRVTSAGPNTSGQTILALACLVRPWMQIACPATDVTVHEPYPERPSS